MKGIFGNLRDDWQVLSTRMKVIILGGIVTVAIILTVLLTLLLAGGKNNTEDVATNVEETTVEEYGKIYKDENGQPITDGKPMYRTLGDVENNDYAPTKEGIITWDITDGIYIIGTYDRKYKEVGANMNYYGDAQLREETTGVESEEPAIMFKGGKHKEVNSLEIEDLKEAWESFN